MIHRPAHPLVGWFLLWDVGLTAAAWVAAYLLRFRTGLIPVYRDVPAFDQYLANLPLVAVLAAVGYRLAGMYGVHRLRRFREELAAVAGGVALTALLVMATSFARQQHFESRVAMGLFAGLAFALVLAARRATWTGIRFLRSRGVNQSHALIVGTGRLARRTARTLQQSGWTAFKPSGMWKTPRAAARSICRWWGRISELPELVARHHVEHVFIALPLNRYADARRVFDGLSRTVVEVRLIADVPALAGLTLTTTTLHGMTVIGLREGPHHGLNVVVKRVMDVFLAGVGLVLLAPLLAAVAAAVKLGSRGPVLYRQERCGLNGRAFWMLKFRTMRADAEAAGPQMTAAADPRRTRLGTFLRVTNLDELPQLWNVLRGDMSLVGPRPERPVYVKQFSRSIPNYMARHAVKAGMTGWAQVNGWRGNSSLRRRVQFDLFYINHWNPLFDVRILFLTVWKMLFSKQKHAY